MASSVIGALRVNLGLDSAQFESGAKRVKTPLAAMKSQFLAVAGAALALGTAISAAALKGAADIDKTAKSARRLGSSIGGYRALEMAAGEAGVSVDTLADAVQTMDREVARGSKNATTALGKLGIAANDFNGMDADQKLALIADRVKEFGLSTGETSALLQDLGIRNREMLLAVMAGGDALRNARADVADYGLALASVDADKIEVANDAIGRLGLIGQYVGQQLALAIVPALGRMAQAMTDSLREGGLLRTMIDGLVGNLERLGTYLAVAVSGFGIRFVAAMAAAKLATFTLAGAMTFLRGAIARTGIGLLVVGELVYQFGRLVTAAGGFGEAMALLRDVVVEVWDRIKMASGAAGAAAAAMFFDLKSDAASGMQSAIESVVGFGNAAVNTFSGAFEAIKAIWGMLPAAIGDLVFQAANSLIQGVESMLNGVVARINSFIGGINSGLEALGADTRITLLGNLELGEIENKFSGAASKAGTAAKDAFNRAFENNPLAVPDFGLKDISREALTSANSYRAASSDLAGGALTPLTSWQALKDTITNYRAEADAATTSTADLNNTLSDMAGDDGSGGSAGAAKDGVDKITEAMDAMKQRAEETKGVFQGAFVGIITGAKSVKEALSDLLGKFAEMLANQAFEAIWGGLNLFGGGKSGGGKGFFGKLFGFANGTPSAPGGLAMVGERGRELVNLPRGSQVYSNQKTEGMLKSGGGTVELIVRNEPGTLVEIVRNEAGAMIQRAAPAIVNQSVAATYARNLDVPIR